MQLAAKKVHPLGALTAKGGEPSTIMTQVEGSGLSATNFGWAAISHRRMRLGQHHAGGDTTWRDLERLECLRLKTIQ